VHENISRDISVMDTTINEISETSLLLDTSGSNLNRRTEELQKDINTFKV
jgi:methyl-accepting chemotaxis protein